MLLFPLGTTWQWLSIPSPNAFDVNPFKAFGQLSLSELISRITTAVGPTSYCARDKARRPIYRCADLRRADEKPAIEPFARPVPMTLPPSSDPVAIVPLHEEDISVERRKVERDVRLRVHTVNYDRLLDEALIRERVEVERIAIGRPIDAVPPVREEGDTTVISVVEEVLVIERRLVLKEEIRLRRVRTTESRLQTRRGWRSPERRKAKASEQTPMENIS
jgi:hypothetical protein